MCIISVVLAAPLSDKVHSGSNLQTQVPVVHGADDILRMKTLSALRETLLPLSETISTRFARVYALEQSEMVPLQESITKTNQTVLELDGHVSDSKAKLAAIPKKRNDTETAKETAAKRLSIAKDDRQRVTDETTAQITSLEEQLVAIRSDQQIVSGLLIWIEQQGGEWTPDVATLAQLKFKLQAIQTSSLMQDSWSELDKSSGVTSLLSRLQSGLKTSEAQLSQSLKNSIATLASEQARLDIVIASQERVFNEAVAQLSLLDLEYNSLTESLERYSLSLSEAQTTLASAEADLRDVKQSWQAEKDQLKGMKDNLQSILLLLPHSN